MYDRGVEYKVERWLCSSSYLIANTGRNEKMVVNTPHKQLDVYVEVKGRFKEHKTTIKELANNNNSALFSGTLSNKIACIPISLQVLVNKVPPKCKPCVSVQRAFPNFSCIAKPD